MSYQVLARKYRPQTFADVVGQDAVVQTLVRALDTGRVAHAFLFTGSRGVGKTTLARILAKCLVCETGITSKPCGVCVTCKGVSAGTLVDVVEIDGASNTGVDQVRDLQQVARFLPQLARFRIFIVDEVHMLSTPAFNALLKILEEPPPHVKFVFATTEPHKIPVTVLSRCQRYDFRRIPMRTIVDRLKTVLAAEGMKVDAGGLDVIARAAEGGMRDALSLTDQVLSFAGDGANADQVTEALGIIDRRSIVKAVEACITGDAKTALAVVEEAFTRGHDQRQLLAGIAEEFRNLAVSSSTGSVQGFADLPDEEIARIDKRAKELDGRDLTRLLALALDGVDPVAKAEDPRVFVELALLKMCGRPPLGDALAISEAVLRLEALAKGRAVPPLASSPARNDAPASGGRTPLPPSAPPASTAAAPNTQTTPRAAPSTPASTSSAPASSSAHPPSSSAAPSARASSSSAAPSASSSSSAPAPSSAPTSSSAAPRTAASTAPLPWESAPASSTASSAPASSSASAPSTATSAAPSSTAPVPSTATARAPTPSTVPTTAPDLIGEDEPAIANVEPDEKPVVIEAVVDEEEPEEIDPAAGLPLEGVDARFVDFVDRVARTHRPMAMHLDHAHPVKLGPVVEIAFAREMHGNAIKSALDSPPIKDALAHAFGDGTRIIIVTGEGGASLAEARQRALDDAQKALEAHARSHPVVEKAVALFGGQVRAVRRRA